MPDNVSDLVLWASDDEPVTRLRLSFDRLVVVSFHPKWASDLELCHGDRAEMFMHDNFADSLLIAKAPFMNHYGHKVYRRTANSAVRFNRTCKEQFVEFFFHRLNRKVIFVEDVKIVMLDSDIKVIALRCPEVEEYLRMQKERDIIGTCPSQPPFDVEVSPAPDNNIGTSVANHATADDKVDLSGVSKGPVSTQAPECNSSITNEDSSYSEDTEEESPIS